jgi:hypothetical protein
MNPMQLPIDQQASWCRDALSVQNACNLSGVAHSFADLCVAMHSAGLGTGAICDHPASQLYAAKVADLTGLNYHYPAAAEAKANALIRQAEALEVVA